MSLFKLAGMLMVLAITVLALADEHSGRPVKIEEVTLRIGMPRNEARAALSAKFDVREFSADFLKDEMEVHERNAKPDVGVVAVLIFSGDTLKSVTRRWNTGKPDTQYGFAEAVLEALQPEDGEKSLNCDVYSPLQHSFNRQLTIRCAGREVNIYVVDSPIRASVYEVIK
jgi:hypothetical protein